MFVREGGVFRTWRMPAHWTVNGGRTWLRTITCCCVAVQWSVWIRRSATLVKGDVLIQGKKIVSVAAELKAPPQAEVIDARNTIVIPGFCGCSPPFLGRPASAHHSQRRYYRIHGYDVSGFCSLLPAA